MGTEHITIRVSHQDLHHSWFLTLEAVLVQVSSSRDRHAEARPCWARQHHPGSRIKATSRVHVDVDCTAHLLLMMEVKRSTHQQVLPTTGQNILKKINKSNELCASFINNIRISETLSTSISCGHVGPHLIPSCHSCIDVGNQRFHDPTQQPPGHVTLESTLTHRCSDRWLPQHSQSMSLSARHAASV